MKLFKLFKSQKGFTLIELLVVIGVLGILATGLLATIDPLEQFRKGSDSNEKTTALELISAFTRYYSVHNTFTWDTVANGGAACGNAIPVPGSWTSGYAVSGTSGNSAFNGGTPGCLQQLVTEGELKTSFPTQYGILSKLWVVDTTTGSNKGVSVCFHPDSKSEQAKSSTNYLGTVSGGPQVPLSATCTVGSGSSCFECIQ